MKTLSVLGSGMFIAPELYARTSKPCAKKVSSDSLGILAIGVRQRGLAIAMGACHYGKMVACCDADTSVFGKFQARLREFQSSDPVYYTDYRKALDRKQANQLPGEKPTTHTFFEQNCHY